MRFKQPSALSEGLLRVPVLVVPRGEQAMETWRLELWIDGRATAGDTRHQDGTERDGGETIGTRDPHPLQLVARGSAVSGRAGTAS